MNSIKFGLQLLGVVIILGATLVAQTSTGTISGLVSDESGAVIPGAQVSIANIETGISRTVQTDSGGRYRVPSLSPGHYEIQAQVTGFETGVRSGVALAVGQEAVINISLKVGQVAQKTVVTAEAPIVETTTSTLSGLVDDKTIRDLPLNGRSFDQLISLEASAPSFHQTNNAQAVFTVNGARTQANLFLMDGTEMSSGAFQTNMPGGALGINMGVDAIQEFQVLTGDYSAAYGKKAGGIVNIATRSGTNQLHGSAFEFLRNSDLDAAKWEDNAFNHGQKAAFKRNQFGGTLGGPIKKDQTFFFGNYEGLRQNLGETLVAIVPNNASRLLAVPAVQPFLTLFPAPNGRDFGDGSAQSINSAAQVGSENFFLTRVDHKLSDKDFIFARYNFTQSRLVTPDKNPLTANTTTSRDQVLTLEEKRVYASVVNQVRFGYTRAHSFLNDLPLVPTPSSLVFFPGAETVGNITFGGVGSIQGALTNAGTGLNSDRALTVNLLDGSDQLFLNRGAHSLEFGVEMQRVQRNENYTNYVRGAMQFTGLQAFLAGTPFLFRAPSLTTSNDAHKGFRQNYFATFVQDDYKVRRNLTLNLGLRYEFMTAPSEVAGRISNYYFQDVNGNPILANTPRVGNPLYQSSWLSFAPRVGFAWDPFGDGKTSVRGGFGLFYDQSLDAEIQFFAQGNPPFFTVVQVSNPAFPFGFSGAAGSAPKVSPDTITFNLRVPMIKTWNFGIQREVTANTVVNISYVGSTSSHLTRRTDGNTAIPTILPDGSKFFSASAAPRNPALGGSRVIATDADANYHALQFGVTQRLSHNLRFKGSYTFSKNLDNGSNPNGPQINGTPDTPQDPYNTRAEWGLSAFDMMHSVSGNFTYDLPGKNFKGVAGGLVGGWELSGIATVQSGTPFTVQTGFAQSNNQANEFVDRPNLKAGANNNPVLGGAERYFDSSVFLLEAPGTYGNVARDTLITPGFASVDFTLAKEFPVKENLKLDFRAEFFNALNRANLGLPDLVVFNKNGSPRNAAGSITSTIGNSRQIQFGLKLLF